MFLLPPYFMVKQITNILPTFEHIGHNIIHADRDFIHYVLDSQIPHQIKTFSILLSIQLAQQLDNIGGHMLDMYFHSIKFLLELNSL